MKKSLITRLLSLVTAFAIIIPIALSGMPENESMTASAASVDYAVELVRISTYDNSRNLNISGYSDKSPLDTWTTNGEQNENWRFDYVGTNSNGSFFKIVNQGTGRLITPYGYEVSAGTSCVIYGSESDVTQHWYVNAVGKDSLGNDLYYKITNYSDPDLALTYDQSSNTISLAKYTGADNQKWLLNAGGLQGFAGYCKEMNGNVKASAIGGLLGKTVEVTTFDELKAACTSTEPLTILITKNISGKTGSSNYEISTGYDGGNRYYCRDNYIYLQPNKTIIGSYGANTLYNVYFRTYSEQYGPGYNVIIRNIDCTHDTELNTDNIWEFAYGWNFWIDHCYLEGHDKIETSSLGSDDWDKFLNFKGTADYVTISDCRFGYHEYGVLLGYPTDDEATYNEYNGKPCVTLANNYYKDTVTRAPALMRYGYFHSLNNYVYNFSMGYTVHTACKVYAEKCYYDGASTKGNVICDWNPITYPGAYAEDGSIAVNCGRTVQGQGTSSNPSYSVACTWRPTSNYSYKSMTAEEAKDYCTTYSGSQTSRSNMTYAAYSAPGVPSAGFTAAPTDTWEAAEPLEGTLIRSLDITDSTRSSWSISEKISVGDKVYGDRDVTYAEIPSVLSGCEGIIIACDAKNSTGDLASFTAGSDMTVYAALDSRVETLPEWLSDWQKTGMVIKNSSDVYYIVYSRCLRAGEQQTLGTNGQSKSCVNYTVFAASYKGDVNKDSKFNIADMVTTQKYLLGDGNVADAPFGDMDRDGRLDAFDLALMRKLLIGAYLTGTSSAEIPAVTTAASTTTVVTTTTTNLYEGADFTFSGNVFLVGDSTVCEYDSSTATSLDRYGWGMKLQEQFNGVKVTNLALSGRSSRSFLTETNYQTLKSSLGKGDYLFIQFGHNDEKTDEATYPGLGTYPGLDWSTLDSSGKDAQGRYSYEYLLTAYYINLAKNKGAIPVLVTPITRRGSDGTPYWQAHAEYQNGMITLGKNYGVPVIDATALTTELYEQVGAANTASLHCYTDAAHTTIDNTHLSSKGATLIAGIIADQTKALGLTLGNYRK